MKHAKNFDTMLRTPIKDQPFLKTLTHTNDAHLASPTGDNDERQPISGWAATKVRVL
jgi:hypothetical protein